MPEDLKEYFDNGIELSHFLSKNYAVNMSKDLILKLCRFLPQTSKEKSFYVKENKENKSVVIVEKVKKIGEDSKETFEKRKIIVDDKFEHAEKGEKKGSLKKLNKFFASPLCDDYSKDRLLAMCSFLPETYEHDEVEVHGYTKDFVILTKKEFDCIDEKKILDKKTHFTIDKQGEIKQVRLKQDLEK